jgi:hypothetical protein
MRNVSGEAMGRETVGGVQLRSGALGGDGDDQGGVVWLSSVSAMQGRGRVPAGWCASIGGRWRWLGEIRVRERFSKEGERSFASGSSFPSMPTE